MLKIRGTFLVTNYKHYEFSPHDITNWCSTILRYIDILQSGSENSLLEIICYEGFKNFGDKLINDDDRSKLSNILNEAFKNQWGAPNITKNIQNNFYVPAPQYSSNNDNPQLQKLNQEEWSATVRKGIIQYGWFFLKYQN